jgi:hypothetical protein
MTLHKENEHNIYQYDPQPENNEQTTLSIVTFIIRALNVKRVRAATLSMWTLSKRIVNVITLSIKIVSVG